VKERGEKRSKTLRLVKRNKSYCACFGPPSNSCLQTKLSKMETSEKVTPERDLTHKKKRKSIEMVAES
jgi:hypothetical protein